MSETVTSLGIASDEPPEDDPAEAAGAESAHPSSSPSLHVLAPFALAVLLSATFVVVVRPVLDTLFWDYDEGWFILGARSILRGLRPFVDFIHHQPPLHLYLLALSGDLFGDTLFGYRMLSVVSLAASGFLLFCLIRPFAGSLPALLAQALFLFSPAQMGALPALPETPTVLFTLLGALLLFVGTGKWSAYASGAAFVVALLIKPTCLLMVLAAVLSLAYARAWRRLRDLAASGVVAAIAGLAWTFILSDGIFADILRFQMEHLGTRRMGMWSIDSGFAETRRLLGIETPWEWALYGLRSFCVPGAYLPMSCLVLSVFGVPIWLAGCARSRPALRAFTVLWPASYLLLNFLALDFVSAKYFIPFLAFSSFLLAGLAWLAARYVSPLVAAAAGMVVCAALVSHFASSSASHRDPWYYGRADWITRQYPTVASFTPMLFAATGTEPGCQFGNPALAYGSFGETFLETERTRRFHFSDERLIECLKANRETPLVVDWAFYFFTRPGSPLREYLRGEGSAQRLFFSPDAKDQWDRPVFSMTPGPR